ncbi:MAG: hypothetical protein GYB65_14350 [Chloroflexi bacterium]|nr:hypothetical protein [Chloroflexota bacterium]
MSRRRHEDYDYDDEYYDDRPRRRTGCWLLLVVLALVATCAGGIVGVLAYMAGEPDEIEIKNEAELPSALTLSLNASSEPFEVEIQNINSDDAITISAVGLEEALFDGVEIEGTDPPFGTVEDRDYPVYGSWREYKLGETLQPGERRTIAFTFQGTATGTYSGDVMVWVERDVLGVSLARAWRHTVEFTVVEAAPEPAS